MAEPLRGTKSIYDQRAKLFLEQIKKDFFAETVKFSAKIYHTVEPVYWADRKKGKYVPITEGTKWGELWESAWFELSAQLPAGWENEVLALQLDLGGEVLLFDEKGVPYGSMTNSCAFGNHYRKTIFRLEPGCVKKGKLNIVAEVGANGLFGREMGKNKEIGYAMMMECGIFRNEVWQLYLDFDVLYSLLQIYPANSYRANQLFLVLNNAVQAYGENPANAEKARAVLAPVLAQRAADSALTATGVGHAHIDVGWMWPTRESIRKAARTFSNQLRNMEEYPDYVFGASQAVLYEFVKDHYPELYRKIKARIKEGRWEVQGGMWVEADCNIISGESMVRQFLHGKNFFKDEFGVDVKNLWLPDVFGYSPAMPQILKKSGCDFFMTQKISWSRTNKFPYSSFTWRGIDRSEVLAHFPPEDTYNGSMMPKDIAFAQDNYRENASHDEFLLVYGVGDGGGGPRMEHIEKALRCRNLEGVPKVKMGRADKFFERLAKAAGSLPVWVGELYLELHRGTLTTQSNTKRNNRKAEQALAVVEFLCSCLPAKDYPKARLDRMWKTLLLNQFHDIIPGSSIREVYEVTEKEHAKLLADCRELIHMAAKKLLKKDDKALTVVNTLSYDFVSPVELPSAWAGFEVLDAAGHRLLTQLDDGKLWALGIFPAQSFTTLLRGKKLAVAKSKAAKGLVLENDLVRYEFDANARLVSAFDKTSEREIISGAAGNVLTLYVDRPVAHDAWDVDITYRTEETHYAEATAKPVAASGPVFQSIVFNLKVGNSTIIQKVTLAANSKRLDFATHVNWKEDHKMLRTAFATTVQAAESKCEIQYGYLSRPTHTNTSWETAKFEVVGHRYADLSDERGGAALLNDCKYGYFLRDGILDLNLLRAPTHPDPMADLGEHDFTYSFLPHEGGLVGSEVMQEAACLNRAPEVLVGKLVAPTVFPAVLVADDGVSLEVVKRAEKSDAVVIRLAETNGTLSHARIKVAAKKLVETNLMEWTRGKSFKADKEGFVDLEFNPFEIRTFILE